MSGSLRNRYQIEPTPEEQIADDLEFEEFLTLSEAELDRRVEAEMRQCVEARSRMAPKDLYRIDRRMALGACIRARNCIRMLDQPVTRDMLRDARMRLVRLRASRTFGYPRSAIQ